MNIFFCILFGIINFILVFRIPDGDAKLRYLKIYGWGIPISFAIAVLVMLLMKAMNMRPDEAVKGIFFGILMSVLTLLLLNIIVIGAGYLIEMLLKFQTNYNSANTARFPVHFVVKNKEGIMLTLKIVFLLGSLLMLYGVWIGKK